MKDEYRKVPFSPPDITEAEADLVRDAVLSGWITTGPRTKLFERRISEYVGTERTVCLNSATAALEMALRMLGVGPGDEVIVPAYTYTATASVVTHVGADVVMVDSGKDTVEMDYDRLSDVVTPRTKVIIPVDIAGIMADYDKVYAVVDSPEVRAMFSPSSMLQKKIGRIAVLADCAHSFGASRHGVMAGGTADFSSFSFHAVKNLTTAEGGALTWNLPFGNETVTVEADAPVYGIAGESWNDYLYRMSQLYSLHGQNKDALAKTRPGAWEYDVIGPWYKCNMTDVAAALGLAQLERYPSMLVRRMEIVSRYDAAFASLPVSLPCHIGCDMFSSCHLYTVRLTGRNRVGTDKVIADMASHGISCNVHYKPLPMMTAYRRLGFDIGDYPNAYAMYENEITLPLNTCMSDKDVDYVIDKFLAICPSL